MAFSIRGSGIYGIYCKSTGLCYYVGQSKNLRARYKQHGLLCDIVKAITTEEVQVRILEKCAFADLDVKEVSWIAALHLAGMPLQNRAVGGHAGRRIS